MNKKSSLFRVIDEQLIQEIFWKSLKIKDVDSATLLSGGMFNTTYKVVYGKEISILRLGPVNQHLLMGFEQHLMEAENYVYDLCQSHGISCPKVIACDTSRQLLDRDYMITEYIPVINMLQATLTQEERTLLQEEIGNYAARLHRIIGSRFGFVSRLISEDFHMSWGEYLIWEVTDILNHLREVGGMAEDEIILIKEVFIKYQNLLDKIYTPHLLHTDLWDGNVLLSQKNPNPCLKAIIDGDRAIFGDEDFEWAAPWMNIPTIYRGAKVDMKAFQQPDRVRRREIYQIVYSIIECYVGIGEYNNPEQYQNGKIQALNLSKKLLKAN